MPNCECHTAGKGPCRVSATTIIRVRDTTRIVGFSDLPACLTHARKETRAKRAVCIATRTHGSADLRTTPGGYAL